MARQNRSGLREIRYLDYSGKNVRGSLPKNMLESRAKTDDGVVTISGYSSVFNVWYDVRDFFGSFQERVSSKAFDNTLSDNHERLGLFNHDANFPLGNTAAGTMRDFTNTVGLRFEIDADPESPNSKTAIVAVESGNVRGASFAFETVRDRWDIEHDTGDESRTLLEVRLFEHGPVTNPASPNTSAKVERNSADRANVADLRSVAIKLRRGMMPLTAADLGVINTDKEQFREILYGLAPVAADGDHPRPDTRELDDRVELLSRRLTVLKSSLDVHLN